MPRTSLSNCFLSIAALIFSKSNTLDTGCSLPEATIQRPDGSVSMPCGDFGTGSRYITPGTLAGSSTGTPPIIAALPSFTACSAARQLTIAA